MNKIICVILPPFMDCAPLWNYGFMDCVPFLYDLSRQALATAQNVYSLRQIV